jgi:hypothetical protein
MRRRGSDPRLFLVFDFPGANDVLGWGLNRCLAREMKRGLPQIIPNTIAARKPNDRSAASTFSRIESSIVASLPESPSSYRVEGFALLGAGRDPQTEG